VSWPVVGGGDAPLEKRLMTLKDPARSMFMFATIQPFDKMVQQTRDGERDGAREDTEDVREDGRRSIRAKRLV
jgi:hypothetical protein